MRKLATIRRIKNISPIEGAEFIEKATIDGWSAVIAKGSFKVGDFCVYCEIDSIMPERKEFEFLRPRHFRIRTIKLRGQISQGIIFPLSILDQFGELKSVIFDERWTALLKINNSDVCIPIVSGEDVTKLLGVTKYDPPIPAELAGKVKGQFPSHSIKTDEERIQNLLEKYDEYKKETWIATEKLDGTSGSFHIYDDIFGVSSRNLELLETEGNTFWRVARELDLENKMRDYMESHDEKALTLQGELIGSSIQKNKYKLKGQTVKFFRAFDPITYRYHSDANFKMMISSMDLDTVPIVETNFQLPEKLQDLIDYADGKSALYDTKREGIVFVATNYTDGQGRLSFKVISNKFILKHND